VQSKKINKKTKSDYDDVGEQIESGKKKPSNRKSMSKDD
jgi:hypothetical protein